MSLRILLANDFFPPFIGGAELQTYLLARELTRRGHQVTVVTMGGKDLPAYRAEDGVEVHRLRGFTTRVPWFSGDPERRFHPPFPDPSVTLGVRRLVDRWRPDLVHSAGWITYSCAAALLGRRVPLLASARDYGFTCPLRTMLYGGTTCSGPGAKKCLTHAKEVYGPTKAFGAWAGVFGGRLLLRRKVSAVHSVSSFVRQTVQRDLYRTDGRPAKAQEDLDVVIPSFMDPKVGEPPEDFLRKLPKDAFLLFVGALRPLKGLGVVLEAYQRLPSPPPLVLLGSVWPDTPRAFPTGVTVIENVPHAAVMAAWRRSLFGLAPSVWPEPLGGVVREGMVSGKAVIGTDIGGIPDMIVHGESGLLVPANDPGALANAMATLIADPALRERLGAAAKERSRQYLAPVVVDRVESLYRRVIAANCYDGAMRDERSPTIQHRDSAVTAPSNGRPRTG